MFVDFVGRKLHDTIALSNRHQRSCSLGESLDGLEHPESEKCTTMSNKGFGLKRVIMIQSTVPSVCQPGRLVEARPIFRF